MKTGFTLLFLFATAVAVAQTNPQAPRSEFVISLSESNLTIKPGESKQVEVTIGRSSQYAKSKATLGYSSILPEGITIAFEPATGNFEKSMATISAAPATLTGNYQLVINSTINYKIKGAILKLSVGEENVAAK